MSKLLNSKIYLNLAIYSLAHFMVDAACISITYFVAIENNFDKHAMFMLIVIYNLLAFGFQPIFGIKIDGQRAPKAAAMWGSFITALAILLSSISPILAVILAGIGNAIFHLGGGTISLSLSPGKTALIGIFVAPGALGVYVGFLCGRIAGFPLYIFSIGLVLLLILMHSVSAPSYNYEKNTQIINISDFWSIIILMLFAIVVRSLLGLCTILPWKSDQKLLLTLTISIFAGKAIGGILADKFGWRLITVGSLIISAPLISIYSYDPALAIIGTLLFNMTMPITLAVIANILHCSPALAFGLTCLALFVGAIPSFTELRFLFNSWIVPFTLTIIASLAMFFGLIKYEKIMRIE